VPGERLKPLNMGNMKLPDSLGNPPVLERLPQSIRRAEPRTQLIAGILAAILIVGALWWIFGGSTPAPKKPPAPVRVATAVEKSVTAYEHTIGTVIANDTVQITARVSGELVSVGFKEGDVVAKGALLFQLDPRPLQAALEQAQAALARDQATLASNQKDAERYATLMAENAASPQQRDQSEAAAKAMAANVQSDSAAVDAAHLNLVYARIVSPVDGKTGPILIQPGNLVTADATTPLVTITQIHPVKISFFLPQSDLPQIQSQMKAGKLVIMMSQHGGNGSTLSAPVDFIGNAVDDKTGTIELRATYDNLDNVLVPGQLVDVSVAITQYPNPIVVPHNAINLGPNGSYVYAVTADSKAAMQPVTVLYDDGTNAAIKGAVKAGTRVVTEGQMRVVPGGALSIRKQASGTGTTAPAQ